jgi:hypothetical protein
MLLQRDQEPRELASGARLPWISVAPSAPYFVDESGAPWTPIGQNDAITWPELDGLFRRRDLRGVEKHLLWLREHGVTCLRLMLEYAQVRHRYFERPAGSFVPAMVRLWDDLFRMCERVGLRILLTPVDTFWTWVHWRWHPWNRANGGPLDHPSRILLCPETRALIKARLAFAVRRWGGSGALFAWDLWNEIHPAQAGDSVDCWDEFILRSFEPCPRAGTLALRPLASSDRLALRAGDVGEAAPRGSGTDLPAPRARFRVDPHLQARLDRRSEEHGLTRRRDGQDRARMPRRDRGRPALPRYGARADPQLQGQEEDAAAGLRRRIFPTHGLGSSRQRRGGRRHALAEPAPARFNAWNAPRSEGDGGLPAADRLGRLPAPQSQRRAEGDIFPQLRLRGRAAGYRLAPAPQLSGEDGRLRTDAEPVSPPWQFRVCTTAITGYVAGTRPGALLWRILRRAHPAGCCASAPARSLPTARSP